ncbi:unnamed protein product [Pedinophyceae sp. YPF-701]|nr:unnamed protein product [Pedinophyceae sp. YPF-701]
MARGGVPEGAGIAQIANEAKKSAVEELHRLLATPDDLDSLDRFQTDTAQHLEETRRWLSQIMDGQVMEMRKGLTLIAHVRSTLEGLQRTVQQIQALCAESCGIVSEQERLQMLAVVRRNLQSTVGEVEGISDIPAAAEAVEALQTRGADMMQVFQAIVALQAMCAQRKASLAGRAKGGRGGAALKSGLETLGLNEYFQRADAVQDKFESQLFGIFENFLAVAHDDPARLVEAAQIVVVQEKVQGLLAAEDGGKGGKASAAALKAASLPSNYRQRMEDAIREGVVARFRNIDAMCREIVQAVRAATASAQAAESRPGHRRGVSSLFGSAVVGDATGDSVGGAKQGAPGRPAQRVEKKTDVMELLDVADELMQELFFVFDHVAPCLPPADVGRRAKKAKDTDEDDASGDGSPGQGGDEEDGSIPTMDPFRLIWSVYHERFEECLRMLGEGASVCSNAEVLAIIGWAMTYVSRVGALGIAPSLASFAKPTQLRLDGELGDIFGSTSEQGDEAREDTLELDWESCGLGALMDTYIKRTLEAVRGWATNIVTADREATPKQDTSGLAYTDAPTDLFRLVNDQLTLSEKVSCPELTARMLGGLAGIISWMARASEDELEGPSGAEGQGLGIERLCALINNMLQSYDNALDLQETIEERLRGAEFMGRRRAAVAQQVGDAAADFLSVSRRAITELCGCIMRDPGTAELTGQLCVEHRGGSRADGAVGGEWASGRAMGGLIATVHDYMNEMGVLLKRPAYERLVEAVVAEIAGTYAGAILMRLQVVDNAAVRRIHDDEKSLRACVSLLQEKSSGGKAEKRVQAAVQPLADLREMLSIDSVESAVLAYTTLLQVDAGVTPHMLERLLASRPDLGKEDLAEIMEAIRGVQMAAGRSGPAEGGDAGRKTPRMRLGAVSGQAAAARSARPGGAKKAGRGGRGGGHKRS